MGKLAEILRHPDELLPMARMYYAVKAAQKLPEEPDLAFCYDILTSVSRSFSVVICQLPRKLRDATCVFYLVLRALDTVEDDMSIPTDKKVPMLLDFHNRILDPTFVLSYGTDNYRRLLEDFPKVNRVLLSLKPVYQEVITDITKRMGAGMAEFIEKDVQSVEDYDLYCFYVAGLVGVGLSGLFSHSKLEIETLALDNELSRHMGLFLQKTNIIRDYLEDIMEEPAPRMFWPKEIWGLYAKKLEDFKCPCNRKEAMKCLNHMIVDELRHLPHCFEYLGKLRTTSILRFCAIPQVMAIGTAARCFDNEGVFEGVVKVRRGETCKVFQDLRNMTDVYRMFQQYVEEMAKKLPEAEMDVKVRQKALKYIQDTNAMCRAGLKNSPAPSNFSPVLIILLLCFFVALLVFALYSPENDKLHHGEF